jgi:hypothetical protein
MLDFMFTDVNGRAASAASEKRRMTSVSQSTLLAVVESLVKLFLHDSTATAVRLTITVKAFLSHLRRL